MSGLSDEFRQQLGPDSNKSSQTDKSGQSRPSSEASCDSVSSEEDDDEGDKHVKAKQDKKKAIGSNNEKDEGAGGLIRSMRLERSSQALLVSFNCKNIPTCMSINLFSNKKVSI